MRYWLLLIVFMTACDSNPAAWEGATNVREEPFPRRDSISVAPGDSSGTPTDSSYVQPRITASLNATRVHGPPGYSTTIFAECGLTGGGNLVGASILFPEGWHRVTFSQPDWSEQFELTITENTDITLVCHSASGAFSERHIQFSGPVPVVTWFKLEGLAFREDESKELTIVDVVQHADSWTVYSPDLDVVQDVFEPLSGSFSMTVHPKSDFHGTTTMNWEISNGFGTVTKTTIGAVESIRDVETLFRRGDALSPTRTKIRFLNGIGTELDSIWLEPIGGELHNIHLSTTTLVAQTEENDFYRSRSYNGNSKADIDWKVMFYEKSYCEQTFGLGLDAMRACREMIGEMLFEGAGGLDKGYRQHVQSVRYVTISTRHPEGGDALSDDMVQLIKDLITELRLKNMRIGFQIIAQSQEPAVVPVGDATYHHLLDGWTLFYPAETGGTPLSRFTDDSRLRWSIKLPTGWASESEKREAEIAILMTLLGVKTTPSFEALSYEKQRLMLVGMIRQMKMRDQMVFGIEQDVPLREVLGLPGDW